MGSRACGFVTACIVLALGATLVSCGGGGGGGSGGPAGPNGPFVVDFETFLPSMGPEPQPFSISGDVDVVAQAGVFIYETAGFWGLGGCGAVATSGTQFLAHEGEPSTGNDRMALLFDPPVAAVDLRVMAFNQTTIALRALDGSGNVVDSAAVFVGDCPLSMELVELGFGSTSDQIEVVEISGVVAVLDDLRYWRYATP